jgi:hypothetical protein
MTRSEFAWSQLRIAGSPSVVFGASSEGRQMSIQ